MTCGRCGWTLASSQMMAMRVACPLVSDVVAYCTNSVLRSPSRGILFNLSTVPFLSPLNNGTPVSSRFMSSNGC